MKSIYVTFDDENFDKLKKLKGKLGWRRFIIQIAKIYKQEDEN